MWHGLGRYRCNVGARQLLLHCTASLVARTQQLMRSRYTMSTYIPARAEASKEAPQFGHWIPPVLVVQAMPGQVILLWLLSCRVASYHVAWTTFILHSL